MQPPDSSHWSLPPSETAQKHPQSFPSALPHLPVVPYCLFLMVKVRKPELILLVTPKWVALLCGLLAACLHRLWCSPELGWVGSSQQTIQKAQPAKSKVLFVCCESWTSSSGVTHRKLAQGKEKKREEEEEGRAPSSTAVNPHFKATHHVFSIVDPMTWKRAPNILMTQREMGSCIREQ